MVVYNDNWISTGNYWYFSPSLIVFGESYSLKDVHFGAYMFIYVRVPIYWRWTLQPVQICNISRTLVGNNIVDHSDVDGACRRCSNYIFFLGLTPGFNGLDKDNCKTRREIFKFGDLVRLIYQRIGGMYSSLLL